MLQSKRSRTWISSATHCRKRVNFAFLVKKGGSERHNNFMDTLDKLISVAELEDMMMNAWGIHLFAEAADQQIAKVAMKLLATKDPKILDRIRR